jgi:hypothetical protein
MNRNYRFTDYVNVVPYNTVSSKMLGETLLFVFVRLGKMTSCLRMGIPGLVSHFVLSDRKMKEAYPSACPSRFISQPV